ncbi:hypothetical protein LWF15_20105 [Kineosporia rhizophila]|uniref:hypothetical protein n=1 Tax=Kineosporia TaxID=49184 RepID=UPI000A6C30C2|nr:MULTISPECIES: hypothetical protein [Kineosporia]MCE0537801.1 hypothetical protein [Kineosporia rhizophila]GLY15789.1 hypothetical protein Kisp01_28040 [Kineosporia sp. NBRC 101677]
MSDIDDLAQSIGEVASKIDAAASEAVGAAQQAEDVAAVAEMIGSESLADGMLQVKDELEAVEAALRNASDQAAAVQALALQVGDSKKAPGAGAPQVPPATADPAGVPSNVRSDDAPPEKKNKVGSVRRWTTKTAKRVEDVQDQVDTAQERFDTLTGRETRPPDPTDVASTSTQAPSSTAGTPASAHGVEGSSLAGGLIALLVATFGFDEIRRRGRRMVRTPKQFPKE